MQDETATPNVAPGRELRDLLRELKENTASWTTDAVTSRLLVGQIGHIEEMIDREEWEKARGAVQALLAGIMAAGPALYGAGL